MVADIPINRWKKLLFKNLIAMVSSFKKSFKIYN